MLTVDYQFNRRDMGAVYRYMLYNHTAMLRTRVVLWAVIFCIRVIPVFHPDSQFYEVSGILRIYWLVYILFMTLPHFLVLEIVLLATMSAMPFLSKHQRMFGPGSLKVDEDGVEDTSGTSQLRFGWPDILKATMTRNYLMITTSNGFLIGVPCNEENKETLTKIKLLVDSKI